MPDSKSNGIYRRLVDSDSDMVGHVSFSIYKRDEILFIEKYKKSNGKPPDDKAWRIFHSTFSDKKIKKEAKEMLTRFIAEAMDDKAIQRMDDAKVEILRKNCDNIKSAVQEAIPSGKKAFWFGVAEYMLATVLLSIIIIALYMMLIKLGFPITLPK
jgi:hypothetical protein